MMNHKTIFSLIVGMILLAATSTQAQTIRLRDQAKVDVEAGGTVELGYIATIEGTTPTLAETLAKTILIKKFPGEGKVRAEEVLCAILAQSNDPSLAARLKVSGAAECVVSGQATSATTTSENTIPATGIQANRAVTADVEKPVVTAAVMNIKPESKTTSAPQGLRGLLEQAVLTELGVKADDVRITFETITPWLNQKAPAGQHWMFRPLTRGYLGTVQWEAQLLQGSKIISRQIVQAQVLQRVDALISVGAIQKGKVLTAADLTTEERWLDRKMTTLVFKASDMVGQEALRGVSAGSLIDQRDFRPVEYVGRNETVTVFFVAGGLRIKNSARALESGKLHDRITLRNENTGEKFEATIIGKRLLAVGAIDDKTEQQLREIK